MTAEDLAREVCRIKGWEFVATEGAGSFKHTCHIRVSSASLALKIYTQAFTERSLREIDAMKRCDHPNIAKFIALDDVIIGGVRYLYLLEEFLAGGSLTTRCCTLQIAESARLALTLSRAIEHIAANSLVHRDIKPDNVMFRDISNDHPVIVDFGLVRDLNRTSLTADWAAAGPGSPKFASPEQLNNDKEMIGARTDQFGLGVTLAYTIFDRHPHWHDGEPEIAALRRVADRQQPSPHFVQLCLENGFAPLVRMVQPYPIQRYLPGDLVNAWLTVVNR